MSYKTKHRSVASKQLQHKHFNRNCRRYISANLSILWNARPFLQPLFINFYASFWFLSGFLLYRNNLNQFCLSARHPANETLQRQIPPPATQNHLKACITANLCQPLLGHGIWRNKLLIITCENAFLSAFLSVWGLTFRVAWREGVAIRINYSLLPLSK